jgi:tRNA(fMet)-specific endonuclease VapC
MRYMLDTSTVSHIVRGATSLDHRMRDATPGAFCISVVTRSELQFGLALRPEKHQLAALVRALLAMLPALPWDQPASDAHGALRAHLRRTGKSIGDFDEMIAAHALACGATLVTDNMKHFKRVPALRVENWLR